MTKKYNIGVIGNGFVGSALIQGFSLIVDDILIHDKDPEKSTHSFEEVIKHCDVIFISVPTPMYESGECDTTIVEKIVEKYQNERKYHLKDQVLVIRSTVVPGTMEKLASMFSDVDLVFNPEFLTERKARLDFINSARIVLGGNKKDAVEKVEKIYRLRFPFTPIIKTDFATAQLIKYMANCFFATKVSYMNEMKQIASACGADWNVAVEGFILDGRIGNSHLDVPGHDGDFGFGGKCFPKDINAMIKRAEELGVNPTVLKGAWKKNCEVRTNLDWYDIPGAVTREEP